ncbi:MAG: hypothetical protein AB7O92_25670 [Acidimicrobiia bacterium]
MSVVLQLPATGDGTASFGTCPDLMLGSVTTSITLGEPFDGKTLVDRTTGLRLALPPAGFVRVGQLALEGWSGGSLRGLLAEQVFVEELTAGSRVISLQQALDRPARAPSEHPGPGDVSARHMVNGVPAILTRFADPTTGQADLVLRWRPGRHGLTLLTWSDLSGAGAPASPDPIDEGTLLALAERIGALAAAQGPAADSSAPRPWRSTPVAIERVRLEPDGHTLTLHSSAFGQGCDPVEFVAAVTLEDTELKTQLTMTEMPADITCEFWEDAQRGNSGGTAVISAPEPVAGTTLVDLTNGERLVLDPPGLVRFSDLEAAGWRFGEDTAGSLELHSCVAAWEPACGSAGTELFTERYGSRTIETLVDADPTVAPLPEDESREARTIAGTPAILTFRTATGSDGRTFFHYTLQWRPARHGITLRLSAYDETTLIAMAETITALARAS